MANSLGSLYIDIQARTATLEQDMAKVKSNIDKVTLSTKEASKAAGDAANSFTLVARGQGGVVSMVAGYLLLRTAIRDVVKEITYVIENVEKIRGVPPEAIVNVQEFRSNLVEAKNVIDIFIAQGISGFTQFGKAVGAGVASFVYGDDAVTNSLKAQLQSLDAIRASQDPGYYEKVRAEVNKLADARKADSLAQLSGAAKIIEYRKQATLLETYAKSNSIDSLQRGAAQLKQYADTIAADKLAAEIKDKYEANVRRYHAEDARDGIIELSQKDKLLLLQQKIGAALAQSGIFREHMVGQDPSTFGTEEMEKANKMFPQLLSWMQQYRSEMQKVRTASMEWRDMTVSLSAQLDDYLTSLVTGGTIKVSTFLKTISDAIIQMFFKLAIINPILNGLFGSSKGFAILPTLFSAKADGGPARGLTLVGERGPELLNLGSGTTVVPNHAIAAGLKGDTYIIDARGADEVRIAQLERNLAALNGSIERRAFSTIATARARRGTRAAAL